MKFTDLNIIEPILKALEIKGYKDPSPIQEQAIPILLEKKDVLGSAQTGTGKTAAFSIPIIQNIYLDKLAKNTTDKKISALVLAPTRELALQIYDNFIEYSKYLNVNATVVYGGIKQARQVRDIKRGVDVLIATPGRLLDLIKQRILTLNNVDYLVVDEADRMLDMGFIKDVKKIVSLVKKERQTMLFSATMPNEIKTFANELLKNPVSIKIAPEELTIDVIEQSVYYVSNKSKIKLLTKLLKNEELKSVLVFSRTKHGTNDITSELLKYGIKCKAIHGDKSQGDRQKALNEFKKKQIRVLVATDIAARGIDVDELSHVINYDLPEVPETYIHRIGRTGRAGNSGITIAFCSPNQYHLLLDIEKHINMKIPMVKDSKFSIDPSNFSLSSPKKKSNKASKQSKNKSKSTTNSSPKANYSYSRKKAKKNKLEPKGFSRHDNKNRGRKSK
jgi:ATP-dependent RNA helicase RhlE